MNAKFKWKIGKLSPLDSNDGTCRMKTVPASRALMIGLLSLAALGCANASGVQTQADTQAIRIYQSIGRVKWVIPSDFKYTFAVPHFTMGPRIRCTGPGEECEVRVLSRDLLKTPGDRRDALTETLRPDVGHSVEGVVRFHTTGSRQEVSYAVLTDKRPNQEYRLLTVGFAEKGPALLEFHHLSNDEADARRFLRVIEQAEALDTPGVWAWRLSDYIAVCATRFPNYAQANERAFSASAFSGIDIVSAVKTAFSIPSPPEQVAAQLDRARAGFAESFDRESPERRETVCKTLPRLISDAAQGLAGR